MKAIVITPLNDQVTLALEEAIERESREWKAKKVKVDWGRGELLLSHVFFRLVRTVAQKDQALKNARTEVARMLPDFERGLDYEVTLR
jgi:hypothetical protein